MKKKYIRRAVSTIEKGISLDLVRHEDDINNLCQRMLDVANAGDGASSIEIMGAGMKIMLTGTEAYMDNVKQPPPAVRNMAMQLFVTAICSVCIDQAEKD